MDYVTFIKSYKLNKNSIFLFEGDDLYLRTTAVNEIRKTYLEDEINYCLFNGDDLSDDIQVLFSSVYSCSLFGGTKVIVVQEYYPTADVVKSKSFVELGKADLEDVKIIFSNQKKKSNLSKIPNIECVDCSSLPDSAFDAMLEKKASHYGFKLSLSNAAILREYNLGNMTKAMCELDKLMQYKSKGSEILLSDIDNITIKSTDYQIFALTDVLGKKNTDRALLIVRDMLSKGSDYVMLMGSLYSHFRRLLYTAVAKVSDAEIAGALDVKEYAIKMARMQCRNFTQIKLKNICSKFEELDLKYKSGEMSVENAFWIFLLNIVTE